MEKILDIITAKMQAAIVAAGYEACILTWGIPV